MRPPPRRKSVVRGGCARQRIRTGRVKLTVGERRANGREQHTMSLSVSASRTKWPAVPPQQPIRIITTAIIINMFPWVGGGRERPPTVSYCLAVGRQQSHVVDHAVPLMSVASLDPSQVPSGHFGRSAGDHAVAGPITLRGARHVVESDAEQRVRHGREASSESVAASWHSRAWA